MRMGYVSNSSSSSFIVYGEVVGYRDALERMDGANVYCIVKDGGTSGDVADFIFRMSPGRMDRLAKAGVDVSKEMFIDVGKVMKTNGFYVCDIAEPLTGGGVYDFDMDHSSPGTDSDDDGNFIDWIGHRR